MKTTGIILRELREAEGLLLREVGAKLSIDPTILSKIERDERMPTRDQINALSLYFANHQQKILVSWLSDKIVRGLKDEEFATQALAAANYKITHQKRI